ncbi:hypothetical protein [Nitrospira sp. M1]
MRTATRQCSMYASASSARRSSARLWYKKMGHSPFLEMEVEAIRQSVNQGAPFGRKAWKSQRTAKRLSLEFNMNPPGRSLE